MATWTSFLGMRIKAVQLSCLTKEFYVCHDKSLSLQIVCRPSITTPKDIPPANNEMTILDRPAVVKLLKPTEKEGTFSDYATSTFVPYVSAQVRCVKRVDIVWDAYFENSLKATTRSLRGTGVRQCFAPNNPLPKSWKDFLVLTKTSKNCFSHIVSLFDSERKVIPSPGQQIISNYQLQETSSLAPCNQKEADASSFFYIYITVRPVS